jgi:hypothetical protein
MKLKGLHFADVAEIQAITDGLKKVHKGGIFSSISETVQPCKSLYICQWRLFLIKKVCVFIMCLRFKNKISPQTFGPHCVCLRIEAF